MKHILQEQIISLFYVGNGPFLASLFVTRLHVYFTIGYIPYMIFTVTIPIKST